MAIPTCSNNSCWSWSWIKLCKCQEKAISCPQTICVVLKNDFNITVGTLTLISCPTTGLPCDTGYCFAVPFPRQDANQGTELSSKDIKGRFVAQRNTIALIFYPLGSRRSLWLYRSSLPGNNSPSCELVSLALPKPLKSLPNERTRGVWGHMRVIRCEEQLQEARATH